MSAAMLIKAGVVTRVSNPQTKADALYVAEPNPSAASRGAAPRSSTSVRTRSSWPSPAA